MTMNVFTAHFAHDELVRLGVAVIAPTITSAHKDGLFMPGDPAIDSKYWYDSGLEKLRRCDAVMVQGDWEDSEGCRLEIREAHRKGIPVFFEIEHLKMWLEQQRAK
jgi:hypothetical protein